MRDDSGELATPSAPGARVFSLSLLLAASVGSGIAHLGTSTLPFQIGALMDGAGMSASAAGIFGFFLIGSLALSMILISPFIDRFNPGRLALVGVVICAAAHLLLFGTRANVVQIYVFAMAAGAGYGLVFSATVAALASVANPGRLYALANGGALIVIVALMAVLPLVSRFFGAKGAFLGVAVLLTATAPAFVGFLKLRPKPKGVRSAPINRAGVPALLALWTSFSLGSGAIWSFAERVGRSIALDPGTIGLILSMGTFFGILGTMVAAAASGRVDRSIAIVVGAVGTGLACLLLAFSSGAVTYALCVLSYWIFYMFFYSYLLGTAAAIDPSGRLGTAGGGAERMGYALGAPIGGFLIDHASYGAVGVTAAVACMALLPITIPAIRRATSHDRAVSPGAA